MTTKITIPTEHYVGMRKHRDETPLAFITPNGSDKAALKRISTVDSWARGRDELDSTVIQNVPLYGFRLTCGLRRGGNYGSGDKWYIEDPRGFQLEISSSNLAYLMNHCTIANGTILDSCVWGRQSGNNVLLATSTQLYKTAEKFTDLSKTTESLKNVKIGNIVILQNGINGIYLGKYHLLKKAWRGEDYFEWHSPQHVIASFDNDKLTALNTFANPKISTVLDKQEITVEEAEKLLNTSITKKKNLVSCYFPVICAVAKKTTDISVKLNEVDDIDIALNNRKDNIHVVKLISGEYGLFNSYSSMPNFEMVLLNDNKIIDGELQYIVRPTIKPQRYYHEERKERHFQRNEVENVYTIEVMCKTKLGNDISIVI